jgi:hypothetical protein
VAGGFAYRLLRCAPATEETAEGCC